MDQEFCDFQLHEPIENGIILRRDEAGCHTNVPHLVTHHSPDGFEWGYGGSGPADLALNIVELILNRLGYEGERTQCYDGDCWELAWMLHQKFKWQFIAGADRQEDRIPYEAVMTWVQEQMVQATA